MKYLISQLLQRQSPGKGRMNLVMLGQFLLLLVALVIVFSVVFHLLMLYEGRYYSWFSGVYWALTVMSTLGFGDITFHSDLGRAFSVVVLLTGMVFLLVMLPFTFIEFFYSPWVKAQQELRAPSKVAEDVRGHVVLTNNDPVSLALIERLNKAGVPHVLVCPGSDEALALHDAGINAVRADLRQPGGFENLGLDRAAMLVATGTDIANTNIVFCARRRFPGLLIAATANSADSVDVLGLAGCNHVVEPAKLLGEALARRVLASDAQAHPVGQFNTLRLAEAVAAGTPFEGKTLRESRLREITGLTLAGIWERGKFRLPRPEDVIHPSSVLVLAGTQKQLDRYNELMCIYHRLPGRAIVIGAGRVGRAAARDLEAAEVDYVVVDSNPARTLPERFVLGSAADYTTLKKAGIEDSPAVIITTRDDETNIYLTIYCRKLRPDLQIISRATFEENAARLHEAGADFVMSYASMGANLLFNLLQKDCLLMAAEGLNVFRVALPEALIGVSLKDSGLRERAGCSLLAVNRQGQAITDYAADFLFQEGDELLLIGGMDAPSAFDAAYKKQGLPSRNGLRYLWARGPGWIFGRSPL